MPGRVRGIRLLITFCVAAGAAIPSLAGQRARGGLVVVFPTPVSSRVAVAYLGEQVDAGLERLHVLVLWRGAPFWFNSTSLGGNAGGDVPGRYTMIARLNGGETRIDLDVSRGTAAVSGHRLDLERANVLFVDHLDANSPGTVVGSVRVDAYLTAGVPGRAEHLIPVLKVPAIREFLDCSGRASNSSLMGRNLCPSLAP